MSFTASLNDPKEVSRRAYVLRQVAHAFHHCSFWQMRHRPTDPTRWFNERDPIIGMQVPTMGEIELTISGITEPKTPSLEATAEAMAAAVLAGDMTAARALADWLCDNVAQPE